MNTEAKQSIGVRLAIRHEGNFVNAYLAKEGDMASAKLLGSIMHSIVEYDADLWERWKAVMSDAMARTIKELFGQTPDMIERSAPQHEKGSRA
jgi:hypothetical protein